MNVEVRSNKPVNSLHFHLIQRNVIIFMVIDCKNYEYSHTISVREPNEKRKTFFKSINNSKSS